MTDQKELPFDGMYGCEVMGTITTGIELFCIKCYEPIGGWSSRQKYPRLQELIEFWNTHIEESHSGK